MSHEGQVARATRYVELISSPLCLIRCTACPITRRGAVVHELNRSVVRRQQPMQSPPPVPARQAALTVRCALGVVSYCRCVSSRLSARRRHVAVLVGRQRSLEHAALSMALAATVDPERSSGSRTRAACHGLPVRGSQRTQGLSCLHPVGQLPVASTRCARAVIAVDSPDSWRAPYKVRAICMSHRALCGACAIHAGLLCPQGSVLASTDELLSLVRFRYWQCSLEAWNWNIFQCAVKGIMCARCQLSKGSSGVLGSWEALRYSCKVLRLEPSSQESRP